MARRTLPARLALALLAAAGAVAPASADAQQACAALCGVRNSSYYVGFTDVSLFSDAFAQYEVNYGVTAAAPGASVTSTLTLKSGYYNFYSGTAGSISASIPPIASNATPITLSSTGGPGVFQFGYFTAVGPNFGTSWLVSGQHNGYNTLDFNVGGSGTYFPTPHGYALDVYLPGNWSNLGMSSGMTEFLGFSSVAATYSVDNMFTYDSSHDVTLFQLSSEDWDANSPAAQFRLYGSQVVPEPTSLALVGTGLLGVLGVARRRKR